MEASLLPREQIQDVATIKSSEITDVFQGRNVRGSNGTGQEIPTAQRRTPNREFVPVTRLVIL
jgi:hypothetical protein